MTTVVTIRPTRGRVPLNLGELWGYRELLYILIWRDIKVRYKQTAIGAAWVVIQPVFAMAVFSLFFGKLAGIPSGGAPYPVFVFSGLLLWQFFSKALTEASTSLVMNERVVTKVYFPRMLVPTAVVLAGLLDFGVASLVLLALLAFYGIVPSLAILTAPIFLLLAVLAALGVGLWLAALDVEFRDVRYTLPFLTQLWLFTTPVIYPSSLVPEGWRALYGLNPMVGIVEGFRAAVLGARFSPDPAMLVVSVVVVVAILVSGLVYFRRMERTLADRI